MRCDDAGKYVSVQVDTCFYFVVSRIRVHGSSNGWLQTRGIDYTQKKLVDSPVFWRLPYFHLLDTCARRLLVAVSVRRKERWECVVAITKGAEHQPHR